MRIPKIFTEGLLQADITLDLDEGASKHLGRVLRAQAGDQIQLFNGDGYFYPAEITQVSKTCVTVKTSGALASNSESPLHTHIGQVLSRGERMDYAIQKSTELGVSEITPLLSERCEVKLNHERATKKRRHWQQVAISAAEQCGRASVPVIHEPRPLEQWLHQAKQADLALVLHHRDTQSLDTIQPAPTSLCMLIGPEGGLSPQEIALCQAAGFLSTTFGPRVMRTETAPVAALALVQWLWGDMK